MAAGRNIKGITIEIGGDTTGLQKALSGVNDKIKSTETQLRDVNRLLKLDPTNTELLGQKHRLLAEKISTTKEKLNALKDAEVQVEQQFKDGKIGIEEYEAFKREIISTEEYLKDFENTVGSGSAKLAEMSAKMEDFGGKATKAGEKMMPVTAGITAVGAASTSAFKEVDKGLDIIITKTGATGKAAEEMEKIFDDVYGSFPADSEAVGAAIGEINTRLGFTGQKLKDASIDFLKFADINGIDVNNAIQLVSRAMGDAGIDASEYGTVLDQLTAASQASGISIDTLAENLTKYGAPMRQLGFDTEASIAIFSQWEKAGVNTEIAFSGMKKAIANWTKEGKDGKEEFANFVKGVQDGSISAQEALDVFGTKAGPDLVDAIQGGRFSYEEFMSVIENSKGTVEDTWEGTQDPIDEYTVSMNNAKLALAEIGDALAATLAPMLQQASEKLRAFSGWFRNLSPEMQQIIVKIALIVAAIGPLLIMVGKISTALSAVLGFASKAKEFEALKIAIMGIKSVISGLIGVISANPMMAAIVIVVAAITLLYAKCEWFRDAVNSVLEFLKTALQGMAEGLITFFTETLPNAWNAVVQWIQGIPAWWAGIWQQVSEFFSQIWQGIMDNPIISTLVSMIQSQWENCVSTLQGIWNGLTEIASGAWELLKNIILAPVLLLIDLVTGDFDKLRSDAANIWNNMKDGASQIWQGLKDTVGSLASGLVNGVVTYITGLRDIASQIWSDIKSTASEKWNSIKDYVSDTARNLKDNAVNAFNNLVSGAGEALSGLGQTVSNGFQSAISFITGLPAEAFGWGQDFIAGIVDGINSAIGWVTDAVSNVASKIRSFLHFSVPDEGPLTDYESWMPDFMQGLAKGIERSKSIVANAVEGVAKDLTINASAMVDQDTGQRGAISSIMTLLTRFLPYLEQGHVMVWETGEVAAKLAPSMNEKLGEIAIEEGMQ